MSEMQEDRADKIAQLWMQREVEDFYALECELIDSRQYDAWLDLLADDVRYWMPLARNMKSADPGEEYTRAGVGYAWFDEGKPTLIARVKQLQSGDHWAEEPQSRTTHIVTNIRMSDYADETVKVNSRFIVHFSRMDYEDCFYVGRREDVLLRHDGRLRLKSRAIYLDQTTLLAKGMTTFF